VRNSEFRKMRKPMPHSVEATAGSELADESMDEEGWAD